MVVDRPAYGYYGHRPVIVDRPAYDYYGYRPVIVDRPVIVERPAYGYYAPRHDLLGGLILGTVIGAAIAHQY